MTFQSARFSLFLTGALALNACAAPPAGVLPNQPAQSRVASLSHNGYASLYSFKGAPDAATPLFGSLAVLDGKLYGTTENGGAGCPSTGDDCGTVYSVTPSGYETVVYSFKGDNGGCDGEDPWGPVIARDGTLYGTTSWGGCTYGTVFSLTPSGSEEVLYKFSSLAQGESPLGALIRVNDNLYGTTQSGGSPSCNCGVVFDVTASKQERAVYTFARPRHGNEPNGIVVLGGLFYGTTFSGGRNNLGAVFVTGASGKERVLYSFKGGPDGANPNAALTAANDVLYGTTANGGEACNRTSDGCGTVFSIDVQGKEKVIYRFKGGNDGFDPWSVLTSVKGVLYGTTQAGGKICECGTVFKVTTSGKEQVLYSFKGSPDGAFPEAGLTPFDGKLYGTTSAGGSDAGQCGSGVFGGCGTIFQISP
jgi:uncharacterized repeat protein (TIGR03803 family)